MQKREIGKKRMQEILGPDAVDTTLAYFESISPDFAHYISDYAYGDIYAREGISDKYREIAAVSCLIGQGNTGLPLKVHLKAMLNVGLSEKEIIELLIFLTSYRGFPAVVDALKVFKAVLDEAKAK